MEEAIITKSGNGWLLTFLNGKKVTLTWKIVPDSWNNAKILVEKKGGLPFKLKNGTEIINKPEALHIQKKEIPGGKDNDKKKQNKYMETIASNAKSPYNFVPLNENVITPENQEVFFDKYDESRNTGYIDLRVENQTSLFIRGIDEKFLLVNGNPIIPGSSLRGLIRTIVEIISFSKMRFFSDSRFYFRSFADAALRLREEYKRKITLKTNVGILYKKGKNYLLIPSKERGTFVANKFNDYIFDAPQQLWKVYSGKAPGKNAHYLIEHKPSTAVGGIPILYNDKIITDYQSDVNRNGSDVLDLLKSKPKHQKDGIPVFYQTDSTNKITSFGNTKNYRLPYNSTVKDHLHPDHKKENDDSDFATLLFGITDEKNKDYNKATRVCFEDLFCDQPIFEDECVLKILSSPRPTSFQLYLEQPLGGGTPPDLLNHWNDTDSKIRGFKNYWHRISSSDNKDPYSYKVESFTIRRSDFCKYLEECTLMKNAGLYVNSLVTKKIIKEIEDANLATKLCFNGDLKGYDNSLRKYIKDYFFLDHKLIKKLGLHTPQYAFVKPLKENNVFEGRIRFENLTDIELGALLFSLELPGDCCHKIGMGKPLGLGSIKISIKKLKLDDRGSRYNKLLNEDGSWNLTEKSNNKDFKKAFSEFILLKLESKEKDLWDIERLKQLRVMLEFNNSKQSKENWLEATRYMTFIEFREREALDTPINIKTRYLH